MSAPTVPRPGYGARAGAALIGTGVVQFVVANVVVQSRYAGYSLLSNYISDLGNTATSPLHVVFNVSIALLGIFAFVGIALSWGAFPRGGTRVVGLPLLLVASIAAILVGAVPENANPPVHDFVSLMVFLPGGLALVVLAAGMRVGSWEWLRWGSLLLGAVTLLSLAYYVPTQANNSTIDPGLIERLIVAPILIWGFAAAVQIARVSRAPRAVRFTPG
ncbi:MAG: DUF998 domain-containing protein [Thermoplasmata archaeon]